MHNSEELRQVNPSMDQRVAGFYAAGEEDIFAVAIRERGDNSTEQHESLTTTSCCSTFPTATRPGWWKATPSTS